jgi:hypothetical protein
MTITVTKKQRNWTIAIIAFIILMLILYWVYKHYFEYNNDEVEDLIDDEASKFGSNKEKVAVILRESAHYVQGEKGLRKLVDVQAKQTGLPKEKLLVDAAIGVATQQGYIA